MIIPEYTLTWTIAGLLLLVGLLGALIIGYAAWRGHREQRMRSIRTRLQSTLLERLFSPDPDWTSWVDTLDQPERRAVVSLLDRYLRRIEGTDFKSLQALAKDLGIPDRKQDDLGRNGRRYEALTWLALLHESVDPDRLLDVCGDNPELRAAGAKILLNSDHPDGPERGTNLLLGDGNEPMTAMGMDTLYRLNNGTDTPLISYMQDPVEYWDESLLVQALLVLSHCDVTGSRDRLDWMPDLLDHDAPRVRLAAISAIRRHGWRRPIRSRINFEDLIDDLDIKVRENIYVLLADWGDDESLKLLHSATRHEHPEDRLSIVEALHVHPDSSLSNLPAAFDPFVKWVRAERNVHTARRIWENASAWI